MINKLDIFYTCSFRKFFYNKFQIVYQNLKNCDLLTKALVVIYRILILKQDPDPSGINFYCSSTFIVHIVKLWSTSIINIYFLLN